MSCPSANEHFRCPRSVRPGSRPVLQCLKIIRRTFPACKRVVLRSDFATLPVHRQRSPACISGEKNASRATSPRCAIEVGAKLASRFGIRHGTRALTAARSIATIGESRISGRTEPASSRTARTITACVSFRRDLEQPRAAFWPGSCSRWCLEANAPAPSHRRRLLTPPPGTIRSAIAARAAGMSPAAAAAIRRPAGVPRNLSQALSLSARGAPFPASAMHPVEIRDCRAQHHRVRAAGPPHWHSPRVFSPQRPVISSPYHNPAAFVHGGRRGSTVLRDHAARPDLGYQLVSQS